MPSGRHGSALIRKMCAAGTARATADLISTFAHHHNSAFARYVNKSAVVAEQKSDNPISQSENFEHRKRDNS